MSHVDHIGEAVRALGGAGGDVTRAAALAQLAVACELRELRKELRDRGGCRAVPVGAPSESHAALCEELSRHRQALLVAEDALSSICGNVFGKRYDALRVIREALGLDAPEAGHAATGEEQS